MNSKGKLFVFFVIGTLLPVFLPQSRDALTYWRRHPLVTEHEQSIREASFSLLTTIGNPTNGQTIPEPGDYSLDTGCTYTANEIETLLERAGSPAHNQGVGALSVELCKETGIDNGYFIAFFAKESNYGTHPGWAGRKPNGYTANVGNIVCAGYPTCYGRFRDYNGDWQEGTRQWFYLLRCYRDGGDSPGCSGLWSGRKHSTVRDALNTYAPPIENDTNAYADYVEQMVDEARALKRLRVVKYGVEGPIRHFLSAPIAHEVYDAPPLYLSGCLKTNVESLHNSSPGLRRAVIPPGTDWSFNEQWQIDFDTLVECGVLGGGVCNAASRWSNTARALGLEVESVYHGYDFDTAVPSEDNIAIWSFGQRGGQDLVIRNTTDRTVVIEAWITQDVYHVKGRLV